LDKLRAAYAKRHPDKEFKAPASYDRANLTGGVSVMQLAPSRTVDPLCLTPALLRLKQRFAALHRLWLWEVANTGLNVPNGRYFFTSEKAAALGQPFLLSPQAYPPRPSLLPPGSPSYAKFREVLSRATSVNDEATREELDMHEDHFEGDTTYFWNAAYMAELFTSLLAIITEHGIEGAGWKSARWEVYDAHARCIQPLYFTNAKTRGTARSIN
ncbi:hypothetical protein DFH06DRAFT_1379335, partial [Mycena polygramma]